MQNFRDKILRFLIDPPTDCKTKVRSNGITPRLVSNRTKVDLELTKDFLEELRDRGLLANKKYVDTTRYITKTRRDLQNLLQTAPHASSAAGAPPAAPLPAPFYVPTPAPARSVPPSDRDKILRFLIDPPTDCKTKVRGNGITPRLVSNRTKVDLELTKDFLEELHDSRLLKKKLNTAILSYSTKTIEDLTNLLESRETPNPSKRRRLDHPSSDDSDSFSSDSESDDELHSLPTDDFSLLYISDMTILETIKSRATKKRKTGLDGICFELGLLSSSERNEMKLRLNKLVADHRLTTVMKKREQYVVTEQGEIFLRSLSIAAPTHASLTPSTGMINIPLPSSQQDSSNEDECTPITQENVMNAILARAAMKRKTGVDGINFHLGFKGSKTANSDIKSTLKEMISKGTVEELVRRSAGSGADGPKKHWRVQYRIKVSQSTINPAVVVPSMHKTVSSAVAHPSLHEITANRTGEGIVQSVESNFHVYQRLSLDRIDKLVEQTVLKGSASEVWERATRTPVYMGAMFDKEGSDFDYANYRKEVRNVDMRKLLVSHARKWTHDQIEKFQLETYFKAAEDGRGGFVEAERDLFSIDHIIPQSFGGYDHPRNYIIMTKSLNSSYKDTSLDEKLSLIGRAETRKLKLWLQEMHQKQRAAVNQALQQMSRRDNA
jgi:hypothetical protein